MSSFVQSILQIFTGAVKAFQTFPAAIINALAFAIVTMVRIHLDWPEQEAYNFLFNCLHWSFALGAIFSLAVITGVQSRYNRRDAFLLGNLIGVAVAGVTFLLLYLWGKAPATLYETRYAMVSVLAVARVSAAILISIIAFIWLAGYPEEESDFSRSFFMTQKAFYIALIYGSVIMAGTSGVAGAIEALLYNDMSEKVYMYLGTLSGFLAFTIFLGYFPDFRKGQSDERRAVAQKQPRFIEILFAYIMIPIMLALTVVLLLWTVRSIASGMGVSFFQLSGIATAYTAFGIWLHMMVTHYESGLAKFYRRLYPLAALVILGFEAWAFVIQLQNSGLKTVEYTFIVIWVIALGSALFLLWRQAKAHVLIAALTCVMALVAVLPLVGYHALPVTSQLDRLEKLLVSQGILVGEQLIPAATEPEPAVREAIADAVSFLAYAEGAQLPVWFDKRLGEGATFKSKLGFEQRWPQAEQPFGKQTDSLVTVLVLRSEAVEIRGYRWAIDMQSLAEMGKGQSTTQFKGDRGSYRISWTTDMRTGRPMLRIDLNDRMVLEENMNRYIDRISKLYPPNQGQPLEVPLKDMSLQLEAPEISALLVFRNVEFRLDPQTDKFNYWLNLSAIYLREKL